VTNKLRNTDQLFPWYVYDWANSAFAMTILAALFGPYLDKVVVPQGGYSIYFLGLKSLSATSLYGYALGVSALLVLLSMPLLGAIADHTASKKRFMMIFCYIGSISTLLMFFVGPGDVTLAISLFLAANFSFVSANVFYDAFLPHIAPPEEQDVVSGKGYAYGYAGGGLLFLLHLLLVQFHDVIGIHSQELAIRIALCSAGLWWGGFSTYTFAKLREPARHAGRMPTAVALRAGLTRLSRTLRNIGSMRRLLIFLVAFMIYNDGIQTVIAMATIYGSDELGFDMMTLMGCLLMVQIVGMFGARMFGQLAARYGSKSMILVSLVVWSCVVVYAYVMTRPVEFWILGGIVGLVLGGSQALSRSLYSRIIPAKASAEFFGLFSVFEKFSAIWGPLVFAFVRQASGSARTSIISLIVFFVVGFAVLIFLDVPKAISDASRLEKAL
jgi:MFS transporter, UMF1 family